MAMARAAVRELLMGMGEAGLDLELRTALRSALPTAA